jgi:hypothetical protein
MLKKKTKTDKTIKENSSLEESYENSQNDTFYPKPLICLFDIDNEISYSLKQKGFNITNASLGNQVLVPNKKTNDYHFCLPDHTFPSNIHEYDIFVIDMEDKEPIPYCAENHKIKECKGNNSYYLLSNFPETVFDPRPLTSRSLNIDLQNIKDRPYILIVFSSEVFLHKYTPVKIDNRGSSYEPTESYYNFSFVNNFHFCKNLNGHEIETVIEDEIKFIYMRRTQSQADLINKPEFSPFKSLNNDFGWKIGTDSISKYNAGFYQQIESDDRLVCTGAPLGFTAALSTISNIRGFDASDVELQIYDEFIPEKHERPIKNEGAAFLNAYETINRNRELKGRKPLQCICLANANDLANPIFMELRLVRKAEQMRRKK